jgi:hypothetical protein
MVACIDYYCGPVLRIDGKRNLLDVKNINWRRFLPPKEDKKKWRTFWFVAIGLKLVVKVIVIVSALWIGQSMHESAAGFAHKSRAAVIDSMPSYSIPKHVAVYS